MKKIISWLWSFIPAPAKVWVAGIAVAAAIGGVYFLFHTIEQKGYNRCQAEYNAAASAAKDAARERIIPTGKKYDKIKADLAKDTQSRDPVGRLVAGAIDRLPGPPAGK